MTRDFLAELQAEVDALRVALAQAEERLRCVPFTNEELLAAIQSHEASECDGECLSADAGREVLRLRGAPAGGG